MTREEIIRNLKYTMEKHKNDTVHTFNTNISVMCKDILDYLEQQPETVTEFADRCKECGARYGEMLKEKTAHWIRWYEEVDHGKYVEHIPYCKCSECGKKYGPHLSLSINYCSNCGRKMVEKERSEDKNDI